MSPPSRGRRKAGAHAPSINAGLAGAAASIFLPTVFFRADGFAGSAFATVAFDRAAARGAKSLRLDDFNGFDAAFCDAFDEALRSCLLAEWPGRPAVGGGVFEDGVFADLIDWPRAGLPEERWGDFLRVFLDIRLPFVAFGGSIMGPLQVLSWQGGTEPVAGQV